VPRLTKSLGLLGKYLLNFTPRNNYAICLMYQGSCRNQLSQSTFYAEYLIHTFNLSQNYDLWYAEFRSEQMN